MVYEESENYSLEAKKIILYPFSHILLEKEPKKEKGHFY